MVGRGHDPSTHRALRLPARPRGHDVADARVPLHPVTRAGASGGASRPGAVVANVGAVARPGLGLRPGAGLVPPSPAPGRGHRRRLRQLPRRPRRGAHPRPARVGEHRCRARRGQRAPGTFCGRQRRRLRGNGATAGARDRHTGAPGALGVGPLGRGPARRPRRARAPGRPSDRHGDGRIAGRAPDQPGGGGAGRVVGGRRRPHRVPRDGPAGLRGRSPEVLPGLETAAGGHEGLCYRVVPFEDRMPQLYSAADVCVSRAGAMSVAELLISGVPAILVPLPGAPRDHQTRNAEAARRAGRGGARARPRVRRRAARQGARGAAHRRRPPAGDGRGGAATRPPRRGRPHRRAGRCPCPLSAAARPARAAAHPRRRHRRRGHERHRAGAARHGPHGVGVRPQGLAGRRTAGARRASPSLSGTGPRTSPGRTSSPIRRPWHPTTSSW